MTRRIIFQLQFAGQRRDVDGSQRRFPIDCNISPAASDRLFCLGVVACSASPMFGRVFGTHHYNTLDSVVSVLITSCSHQQVSIAISISGLVVEYIVAIDVTRARFPADAFVADLCGSNARSARDTVCARAVRHRGLVESRMVGVPKLLPDLESDALSLRHNPFSTP